MKHLFIIGLFSLVTSAGLAQRVYFVEENEGMEATVKQKLLEANQSIINSEVGSDYILKTSYTKLSLNQFTLKMTVIDSLTYKTVMEDNECYRLLKQHKNMRRALWLAMQSMMEKNLRQMLQAVETSRLQSRDSKLNKNKI